MEVHAGSMSKVAWEGLQMRKVTVNTFYKHPYYIKLWHQDYDIAMAKLSVPLTELGHNGYYLINPICLPQKTKQSNTERETAVDFGTGLIRNPDVVAPKLQKATFIIEPYTVCAMINDTRKPQNPDELLCANVTQPETPRLCVVFILIYSNSLNNTNYCFLSG